VEKRMQRCLGAQTHSPTRQDRVIVLLMSAGVFLLLLPLARNIHPQAIGWIVMVIVLGLPMVIINVLLPFSRWEQKLPPDGSPTHRERLQKESGGG